MNYYYQNRSGMDISEKYITSYAHSDMREKLAHSGFHEKDEAYIQSSWDRSYSREFNGDTSCKTDVSGGWYTSSNYSKNVPAGAHAVWLLQNMYNVFAPLIDHVVISTHISRREKKLKTA